MSEENPASDDEIDGVTRRLDQLTFAVSHELRAPLRQAGQLAAWIREDAGELAPEPQANLERLERCLRRAQAMLDAMLELSRIGRLPHPAGDTPLSELIERIRSGLVLPAGVSVSFPESLPRVAAEHGRVAQALAHLVENALQHGVPKGGEVALEAREEGQLAVFEVRDDGGGMDAPTRASARDLFRRGRGSPGLGAGLAIVDAVARDAGGRFELESALGEGTRARLWVPLGRQAP